jgi:hypothetical protein
MQYSNQKTELTLAEVCEAIATGRLATSVECGRWYVIRERDIALLMGTAMPSSKPVCRSCFNCSTCLN